MRICRMKVEHINFFIFCYLVGSSFDRSIETQKANKGIRKIKDMCLIVSLHFLRYIIGLRRRWMEKYYHAWHSKCLLSCVTCSFSLAHLSNNTLTHSLWPSIFIKFKISTHCWNNGLKRKENNKFLLSLLCSKS